MFRKLDLFPSSGEGRHLLCWVSQKELTSITGQPMSETLSSINTWVQGKSMEANRKKFNKFFFLKHAHAWSWDRCGGTNLCNETSSRNKPMNTNAWTCRIYMNMKICMFWYITPFRPVKANWRFVEIYHLHCHGQKVSQARSNVK
jgi:hypothetical protein